MPARCSSSLVLDSIQAFEKEIERKSQVHADRWSKVVEYQSVTSKCGHDEDTEEKHDA